MSNQKKSKLEYYKSGVTFLTSILALGLAILGVYNTVKNSNNIDKLTSFAQALNVSTPKEGDSFKKAVRFKMEGVLSKKIPPEKEVRVFAKEANIFYPMKDKIIPSLKNGEWTCSIFLGITGKFDLLIYLLDKSYAEQLDLQFKDVNIKALEGLDETKSKRLLEINNIYITP